MTKWPVSMTEGPVGMTKGPVSMTEGPVGMTKGPVGMTEGPVGVLLSFPTFVIGNPWLFHAGAHEERDRKERPWIPAKDRGNDRGGRPRE